MRAEFRAFVLTGKLAPRPEVDADAYLSHLDLVVDAMTVQQRASIESVESLGMLVESEGLSVEATNPSEDPPPTPMATPTEAERKCWLKYAVRSSRLSRCFSDLYEQTRETGPPDMDCDDFADAFIRYLLRSAPPGWSPHYGVIAWRCKERMQDGSIRWVVRAHALSVFRDPQGKWWFVDPRKGTIGGSFDSERALFIAMNAHCNPGPGCRSNVPGYEDHLRPIRDDVLFGLLGESKPWWQSPDRRSAFCAALRSCCGRPLGGVSGGCPLPAWAPPLPSGCDIRQYLPEPLPTWKEEWGSLEDCTATGPQ